MKHLGTKVLKTDRLTLRPFRTEDAQAMFANWAGDPEVTKYLTWQTHESTETSKAVLSDWIGQYAKDHYYLWAIVPNNLNDQPIGSIAAVKHNDEIEMVHIGYCIGRKWWHSGLTSEALAALINFFFTEVGVNRVESRHDPRNANSGKVMLKCGMKYEGIARQGDFNNQGICDAAQYAILAEEYSCKK